LIAWDPLTQSEVWRSERAGQANGGALSTAGGLVFQGTGSGEFLAMDAATGETLWSYPTQTGVLAAPVSYAVDGTEYVAIVVGSGGSWGVVGGDMNIKGNDLPNISRVLVYALGGTAELPPPPARPERNLAPPRATASPQTVAQGGAAYDTLCGGCHGVAAINLGILPDLRYSAALGSDVAWRNIVLGGTLEDGGMASFAPVLDEEQAEAIRAFVVARANQDMAAVE
jgi:mono/diheme cytochrome c family protein